MDLSGVLHYHILEAFVPFMYFFSFGYCEGLLFSYRVCEFYENNIRKSIESRFNFNLDICISVSIRCILTDFWEGWHG